MSFDLRATAIRSRAAVESQSRRSFNRRINAPVFILDRLTVIHLYVSDVGSRSSMLEGQLSTLQSRQWRRDKPSLSRRLVSSPRSFFGVHMQLLV